MLLTFAKRHKTLLIIAALAFIVRIIDINWDNGLGLHPDERMIMFVVERLTGGNLNPDFFNYGNLPIYLLKGVSSIVGLFDPSLTHYPNILYVGRLLSTLFDTGTTILIFLISTKLFHRNVGIIAGILYATAVFPIQNAHFYIVDPQMTFWMFLTVWILIRNKLSSKTFLLAGITTGLASATKFTGVVTLGLPLLFIAYHLFMSKQFVVKQALIYGFITLSSGVIVFFATQPYTLLEFATYIKQVSAQLAMSSDASVFPYTKQFIPSIAYIEPAYGIISWGLGLPLGLLSLLGLIYTFFHTYQTRSSKLGLLLLFFGMYFLVFGQSAVKYMRYYLPLYPILILCAAIILDKVFTTLQTSLLSRFYKLAVAFMAVVLLVWPIMYLTTLQGPHTRVIASDWIFETLELGSTILSETWDDALPFGSHGAFTIDQLDFYSPESDTKWETINSQLKNGDYLVLSSKRVYRSILLNPHEYPETSQWYLDLFNGRSEYQLIKTFTSYPRITFGSFSYIIPDNISPESFTIFDHPKVMIFKNISKDFEADDNYSQTN